MIFPAYDGFIGPKSLLELGKICTCLGVPSTNKNLKYLDLEHVPRGSLRLEFSTER